MFGFQVDGCPRKQLCLSRLIDYDGPGAHTDLSSSLIGKLELHFLNRLSYGRALCKVTF